jgi:hypothetical protein
MMYHSGNFQFSHLALREKSAENTLTDFLYWDVEPGVPVALAKINPLIAPPPSGRGWRGPYVWWLAVVMAAIMTQCSQSSKNYCHCMTLGSSTDLRAKNRITVGLFYRELYSILTDSLRTMFITTTYHTTTIC